MSCVTLLRHVGWQSELRACQCHGASELVFLSKFVFFKLGLVSLTGI